MAKNTNNGLRLLASTVEQILRYLSTYSEVEAVFRSVKMFRVRSKPETTDLPDKNSRWPSNLRYQPPSPQACVLNGLSCWNLLGNTITMASPLMRVSQLLKDFKSLRLTLSFVEFRVVSSNSSGFTVLTNHVILFSVPDIVRQATLQFEVHCLASHQSTITGLNLNAKYSKSADFQPN